MHMMSSRIIVVLGACLIAFIAPVASAEGAQPCRSLSISDVYEQLLSVDSGETDKSGTMQTVAVRYIPYDTTLEPELRIVIREGIDDSFAVTVTRPKGASIYQQFRGLRERSERCDLQAVAMDHLEIASPATFRKLYAELRNLRVPAAAEPHIYLDASQITVAVRGAMAENRFTRFVRPGARPPRDPLARWVLKLIAAANAAKK